MKRRRGAGLATVMAAVAAAFFLMSVALAAVTQVTRQEVRASRYERALRYAQTGFQEATAHLRDDPDWAGPLPAGSAWPGDPSDAGYQVTSDNRHKLDSAQTTASGVLVPAGCVYVSSQGQYAGVKATVEAVFSPSDFPYALASSGPLKTSGSFLVGAVDDASALDGPLEKALQRGSLLSNAPGVSINLASGSAVRVTGDVVTVGTAALNGAAVEGTIKEHRDPKDLPEIKISDFDPIDKHPRTLETNELTTPEAFEGYVRGSGEVKITGDLKLDEAIVYIDGNLTITGKLSGVGALFSTGTVTLGSSSIGAISKLAIVSGSDLTITGESQSSSRIAGLLVSKGNLSLQDVTVVGCVLCAGSEDRVLTMHNVEVYGSPEGTSFEFKKGWGLARSSYSGGSSGIDGGPGGLVRLARVPDGKGGKRAAVPADFSERFDENDPEADLLTAEDFEVVELDANGKPLIGPDLKEIVKSFSDSGLQFADYQLQLNLLTTLQQLTRDQAKAPADREVSQGSLSLELNKFLKIGETTQVVYRRIR